MSSRKVQFTALILYAVQTTNFAACEAVSPLLLINTVTASWESLIICNCYAPLWLDKKLQHITTTDYESDVVCVYLLGLLFCCPYPLKLTL